MTRRSLRDCIFKLLFRVEFIDVDEMDEQIELFFEDLAKDSEDAKAIEVSEKDREYIVFKVKNIVEKLGTIDDKLSEASEGWTIKRLGKAELAILRLALFEIRYDDDIPDKVAVNEAVNLAKEYCNQEAPAFINGVLARFCS